MTSPSFDYNEEDDEIEDSDDGDFKGDGGYQDEAKRKADRKKRQANALLEIKEKKRAKTQRQQGAKSPYFQHEGVPKNNRPEGDTEGPICLD